MDETETRVIQAPWTEEQVEALNVWQSTAWVHPFTCGNRGDGDHPERSDEDYGQLVATEDGWICLDCDYTQGWAYEFMFAEPVNPWQGLGLNAEVEIEALEASLTASEVAPLPLQDSDHIGVSLVHSRANQTVMVVFTAEGGKDDGRMFGIEMPEPMFYAFTAASVRLARTFEE